MPAPQPRRRELNLLLAAGAILTLLFGDWMRWGVDQVLPFVVALGLLLIPQLTNGLQRLLDRVRTPSRRASAVAAAVIAILSLAVLLGLPLARGYEMIPRSHDEHMHLLQAQMLARFRLWMPPHPLGDFFETFFVLTRPVYASIYFPGASLLFTPGVWLGLPYWVMPAVLSAAAVGLMYLVLTEAIDGPAGLIGAVLLLASSLFREVALLPMSHSVMLLLALAATYAWIRWRAAASASPASTSVIKWAAVAGAAGGLAAITRPLDALCYVLPLALASVPALRRMPPRAVLKTIAVTVAAALPFLALQLILNVGTTGRPLYGPYALYLDTQQPGTSYGFHRVADDVVPQSQLPQKHVYYEQFHRPAIQRHRPERMFTTFLRERVPLLFMTTVPHPLLLLALPLALLGLRALPDRVPAVALLSALPALALGYAFNALLLSHYLVVWMPPMILLVVLAPLGVARAFPRLAGVVPAAAALLLLAAVVSAQPGINPHAQAQWTSPEMSDVHRQLAALPHKPALVFFHYDPPGNVHHEPVYNVGTAWPDDAEVVRAHDLGAARNAELVRYYADREPARHVYVYDRSTRQLHSLGPAEALLEQTSAPAPPMP